MHKLFISFILLTLFVSSMVFAQVGINTENPRATLHIEPADATNPDASVGIIVPRVAQNPNSANENGQLIYNTTDNTFYFWNDPTWIPIGRKTDSNINSLYVDSREASSVEITNNSTEIVIPGAMQIFAIDRTKPVQFNATVSFSGISSAFAPLFKLKLINLDTATEDIIDMASNTYLSDGISNFYGNLPLLTIKNLVAGNYKIEVVAYYNDCCSFDFKYIVGGSNTPVSILVQY